MKTLSHNAMLLAEEAAMSAHDLGLAPEDAPTAAIRVSDLGLIADTHELNVRELARVRAWRNSMR